MAFTRLSLLLSLFALLLSASGVSANNDCRLCSPSTEQPEIEHREIPLSIDIATQLDFSRAARTGTNGGMIQVDAQNGNRSVNGELVDLGGYGLAGTVIVHGEPGRNIRIDMPNAISMRSVDGGDVQITDLRTNLSPAPRLDNVGRLSFAFGGRLMVQGNVSGTFRGRIPITAQYE